MSFTIREANINDSLVLFDMVKAYHEETNLRKKPFTNSISGFIKECFENQSKIFYHIAEYGENIIGYSAFVMSYDVLKGSFLYIKEVYIKPDYRNIGVASFLFTNLVKIAHKENCFLIKCIIDRTNDNKVALITKNKFEVKDDLILLNIFNDKIELFLESTSSDPLPKVRFAKSYELHDLFGRITELATEINEEQHIDLYKIMKDGFASNPKFKILVTLANDEVVGFVSFYEAYNTYIGKYISVDKVFVSKEYRNQKHSLSLLNELSKYASNNSFEKIESCITKFDVEKIEQLKEFGIYPYDNLRVAELNNNDFSIFLNE